MLERLRLIFAAAMVSLLCSASIHATKITGNFQDESLNYKVMYKWGLVQKQAGRATLSIHTVGPQYHTQLTARSEKWADRFFKVRDTLSGVIMRETFTPMLYIKKSHEGDEHKHDQVKYIYSGARVIGDCTRQKWDKKGNLTLSESRKLEAYGTTVDMLSSFYFMRALPYQDWKEGHVITTNIYSGKRKELLTIKYMGIEKVKCNNTVYPCYHIRFTFTDNDRAKTSDDMDAWISTDSRHIPIKMEGKLKVGKVQCFYTGSNQ